MKRASIRVQEPTPELIEKNPQGKSCHFPAEAPIPEMSLLSA